MSDVRIRPGADDDLPALTEIYNHYVRETAITFDLEPFSVDGRRPWMEQFAPAGPYRLVVAEAEGRVVGYASATRFRPKGAYATSVETTVYVAPQRVGAGFGSRLYAALFEALHGEDVHRAYAGITLPNDPSIRLHERFGFERIGVFREVGRKFERYWDVAWYDKKLA